MKSFEADKDVEKMLDDAEAGGIVFKELMNEALRKHGPELMREQAAKMREQAKILEAAAEKQSNA